MNRAVINHSIPLRPTSRHSGPPPRSTNPAPVSLQAAQAEREGGEHERVGQLEQQLTAMRGDLHKMDKERAAARKESGRQGTALIF